MFLRMAGATLVATAIVLGLARWMQARTEANGATPRPRRWAALALGAGVLAGFVVFLGVPTLPFGEDSMRATDRLFFGVALAALLGLSSARRSLSLAAVFLPAFVIAAHQDLAESAVSWAIFSVVGLLIMEAGDRTIRTRTGPVGAVQIGIVLGVVPAAIALSGSMAYGQLAGTAGLGFGLITLVAWRNWDAGQIDGAFAMLMAGAFALMAMSYSELNPLHAGLLLGALPLSLLATAKLDRHKTLVGWVVLLAPIVIAFVLIGLAYEPDPYADYM